jgi:16S rRNA (guanine527-N7)-methyltransferase
MTNSLPAMADIWQNSLNWLPNPQQEQEFQRLYELILAGNRQFNLTRITAAEEFWEKHLWDALRGVAPEGRFMRSLLEGAGVIDIGTGAGFPGVPVGIALPNCEITLVDSTRKKVNFIEEVLTKLSLIRGKTVMGRAEEIGHHPLHRQAYDVALIRAVGSAAVCAEYTLPLVKRGGLAVIYRGHWTDEESTALQNAVNQLGGRIELVEQFTTPLTNSVRHCLYLRKVATTPGDFPRGVGIPNQKPL